MFWHLRALPKVPSPRRLSILNLIKGIPFYYVLTQLLPNPVLKVARIPTARAGTSRAAVAVGALAPAREGLLVLLELLLDLPQLLSLLPDLAVLLPVGSVLPVGLRRVAA